jgi:hypothetical protein
MTLTVDQETAALRDAIYALLDKLNADSPELVVALADMRVTFDTRARVLTLSPIFADGTSAPIVALKCDPNQPDVMTLVSVGPMARGDGPPMRMH